MTWEELKEQAWLLNTIESAVIIVLAAFTLVVVRRFFASLRTRVSLPAIAHRSLRRTATGFLYILAIYLILMAWGVPLGSLAAVIGGVLAMVAIGFVAVWSLLSNLLSALVMLITRPFRIGDSVEIPSESIKGRAIDMTFLFTTLKDDEGFEVRIPNNMFFQKIFRCRAGKKTVELDEQISNKEPLRVDDGQGSPR